jgi:hypothetical protein
LQSALRAAQLASTHEPLQQSASSLQASVSDTQASAEHLLVASQWKLQQSVPTAQLSPEAPHVPTTDAQLSLAGSQTPEQHSAPFTQVAPIPLHSISTGPWPPGGVTLLSPAPAVVPPTTSAPPLPLVWAPAPASAPLPPPPLCAGSSEDPQADESQNTVATATNRLVV